MSQITQQLLAGRQVLGLPILAMLIFAATFAWVLLRALRTREAGSEHDHLVHLPLQDHEVRVPAGQGLREGGDHA